MKLVVVTSRFPWPIEKGDKLRIYNQIKHLTQQHEVLLISIVDKLPQDDEIAHLKSLCSEIRLYTIPFAFRLISIVRGFLNGKPAQVSYFFSHRIKKKIYREIIQFQPDRIYCQLIRVSEYVKTLPFIKVLDFMDCFSAGMSRQAAVRKFPMNLFYRHESQLIRNYEREVYSYFDETTIISDRDRSELPLLSKNLVNVISNGIDTNYFIPRATIKEEFDIVFVGNMGYKPNEQAVLKMLEWIRNSELRNKIRVMIAGARPTQKIRSIEEPGWEITGWVDDVRSAYWSAKIFAAPLLTGSGLQNKILEAMASGLPCITTGLVNDSIDAKPNEHILIADNENEFIQQVHLLLNDSARRIEIGENARNFVVNNYKWSEFNTRLENIIIHAKSKALGERSGFGGP